MESRSGGHARSWYRIAAKAAGKNEIEVMIYDDIGLWGITAKQLIEDFNAVDDGESPVVIAINSPGGDLFDGFALNAWIDRLGARGTVRIDGMAASAASVIAVGGHKVVISQSAMMMIHNPYTFAYGNADDLRKSADMMDKARDGIIAAYRRKASAIDEAALIQMLDDETWMSAEEAVSFGFADAIVTSPAVKACLGKSGIFARFRHPPRALIESGEAEPPVVEEPPAPVPTPDPDPVPAPAPDTAEVVAKAAVLIIKTCHAAGIPEIAEEIIMNTKLTDGEAVAAEAERIKAIRDLCVLARLPELAIEYVKAGLSADAARARLTERIAEGVSRIDNKEPEKTKEQATKEAVADQLNPDKIYTARKGKKGTES